MGQDVAAAGAKAGNEHLMQAVPSMSFHGHGLKSWALLEHNPAGVSSSVLLEVYAHFAE